MASRNTSTLFVVTVTLAILAAVAFFGTTIYFIGQATRAQTELQNFEQENNEFVRTDERQNARVQGYLGRRGGDSLVSYLIGEVQRLNELAVGQSDITAAEARARLSQSLNGAPSAAAALDTQAQRIAQLEREVAEANTRREEAFQAAQAERQRVQGIQSSNRQTIDRQNQEIAALQSEVDRIRGAYDDVERQLRGTMDQSSRENEQRLADARGTVRDLRSEIAVLRDQILRLRGENDQSGIAGADEFALVDGRITSISTATETVIINRGRQDKIRLGMKFVVYSDALEISPIGTGEYSPGKAEIEVIQIEDRYSVARITRESDGNPIGQDDVIANALYDPNKTYRMLVYGNFDYNGDGIATPLERDNLITLIQNWGGEVTDDASNAVDFFVLGEKPTVPPQPGANAPQVVVDEYLRRLRQQQRYDELFDTATRTSIPILNENRLQTLIGELPR